MDEIEVSEVYGPVTTLQYLQWLSAPDLNGHIRPFEADYAASQYLDVSSDTDIDAFLRDSSLYNCETREWRDLPNMQNERDIRARLKRIVSSIIHALGKPSAGDDIIREVHTTDYQGLLHVGQGSGDYSTAPAMVIRATGPSFDTPPSREGALRLGYSNITSCFEVITEEEFSEDEAFYAEQSSVFAREMFAQQPNRRFVRNLLLTQEVCHLFHFDRSGAQYTSPISIHEDPRTFLRLVLGLSSFDELTLGFDPAFRWVSEGGRKVGGAIDVLNHEGVHCSYTLLHVRPVFRRYDIRGRGTTGWSAVAPSGVKVFIKDAWRPEDHCPEYDILLHTRGVEGATQMLSYEVREVTTAALRGSGADGCKAEGFRNRTSTRIVIEMQGQPISSFQSQRQLFAAIRDAISAHRTLVNERDVLHRDISQNNILLGRPSAPPGHRGVLADYDMAFHGKRGLSQSPSDPKAGTLLYMSVSVLASHRLDFPCVPNHDPLDDLESFYCVVYDMMCSWENVGRLAKCRPTELQYWDVNQDPAETYEMKPAHFFNPRSPSTKPISPFWLPASMDLLVGFYQICRPLVLEKMEYQSLDSPSKQEGLRRMLDKTNAIYDQILALFDKTLLDLVAQEGPSASPNVDAFMDDHSGAPSSPQNQTPPDCSPPQIHPSPAHPLNTHEGSEPTASDIPHTSWKRRASPDFDEPQRARKRARRQPVATAHPYSPPWTRSAARAANAQISMTVPLSNAKPSRRVTIVSSYSPPKTRAAVKAALVSTQCLIPAPVTRDTPRTRKDPSTTAPGRRAVAKTHRPDATKSTQISRTQGPIRRSNRLKELRKRCIS